MGILLPYHCWAHQAAYRGADDSHSRLGGAEGMGFPKKEILMAYISRSCDLDKNRITQKGNFRINSNKFI
jgi:hypothetical protein